MLPIPQDVLAQFEAVLKERAVSAPFHADYRKWLRYFLDFGSKYPPPDSRSEQVRLFIEKLRKKNQTSEQQKQAAHALSLYFEILNAETKAATRSTSSQYRATTEGLPLQVSESATSPATPRNHNSPYPPLILRGGGEAGGVTIKGEYSNLSKTEHGDLKTSVPQASLRPFVPPLSAYSRYNEWRCLEKSGSPAWDKIIDNLVAKIKIRHYSRKTLKAYAELS